MAYSLRTNEHPSQGVRRIAMAQIERAMAVMLDKRIQRDQAVHQARQHCKQCRALLKLLGGTNSELSKFENEAIRDAAARLAHVRDADAVSETYNHFRRHASDGVSRRVLHEVRQVLTRRRQLLSSEESHVKSQLESFIADMTTALSRLNTRAIELDGPADLMLGFARSYRHGRQAMKACRRSPSNDAFHTWRKWSKYQLYQTRLLKPYLKNSFKHRMVDLKRLGKLLGIDHDLAVLRNELVEASDFKSVRTLAHFGDLLQAIDRRRMQLQMRSLKLGKQLYTTGINKRLGIST
jgi:CHAD domain-containing protein